MVIEYQIDLMLEDAKKTKKELAVILKDIKRRNAKLKKENENECK